MNYTKNYYQLYTTVSYELYYQLYTTVSYELY